ncbi:MAG: tetratricopeptide repeat protein [Leptolinea sp.]|jgi:ATP/maltotriose-dependent transcriptional regulator MalT/two-component SAPR family response regulator|nr:tetratricopeptide repeat protein [Leptolinea sp.]
MSQEFSIIRTRITPPRRRGELVTRQRLIDLLNELLEKRLVLVSAPAGYGKTSLLVDYASCSPLPVCWYTVDTLDFDPRRFISYFIAAIHQRFPAFGERSKTVLNADQVNLDVETIASIIINDLYEHVAEHFVIILDDLHLVNESVPVRNFISRFLQDTEENCHVLITSRSLLSLPVLPMLAARSEVGGFSFEELAFQPDEIQALYEQTRQKEISKEIAEEILNQTEGWITGIILTSQITRKEVKTRSLLERLTGFGMEEYFLQIINEQPAELRSFLLWSSLLEEFNETMCSRILGKALNLPDAPWSAWMDAVQRNNLFALPVGDQGDWLRYHPLFLEFLQTRVFRECSMLAAEIERCLATDYIENREWDRAFSIYRRLNSQDDLLRLIERAGPDILAAGRISTLSAWIDVIPDDVVREHPVILGLKGKIAFSTGDTPMAMDYYNQAVNGLLSSEDIPALCQVLVWRANLHRLMGDLDSGLKDANHCIELVEHHPQLERISGDGLRCIGLCIYHKGKLKSALTWLQKAYNTVQSLCDRKNEAEIQMEIGIIYENIGQYDRARDAYEAALNYWKQTENQINQSILLNNLGVLQQMMGEYEQASDSFKVALELSRSSGYTRMEAYILTGIADMYTELQADDQAAEAFDMASAMADRLQEHFLQVYIGARSAALAGLRGDISRGYQILQQTQTLINMDGSEMENQLYALELGGLKVLDKKPHEAIPLLDNACTYFGREGHKIQYDRAHLYLILAYHASGQEEKMLEHILHIQASMDTDYPPIALIALSARFKVELNTIRFDYLQSEITRFRALLETFEEKLPVYRRYLRENSQVIPFAPPTLFIRALGRMQVQVNNHKITNAEWQTQAARELFFLLLAHPEGMTREEICVIFWPDASIDEAKFRFKNTIYRLRRAVGKNSVLLDQEIYRFNNKLDYEYDVESFLKANALASQANDPLKKLSHYREAIKLFRGNYLNEIEETWALNPREYLRQNYLNILINAAEIYLKLAKYDQALEYCQRALEEDNLLEDAYRLALRAFAGMGNRVGMIRQYQRCVEVLEREINAAPSQQTQALYQELLR